MQAEAQENQPLTDREIWCSPPKWWHHHGEKVNVIHNTKDQVILGSRSHVSHITIARDVLKDHYFVHYQILQSPSERFEGRIVFSGDDLRFAFGLYPGLNLSAVSFLLTEYSADVAEQGKYIRLGSYLNIPGPGTGHDCDPNLSIKITDEIQDALRLLLGDVTATTTK